MKLCAGTALVVATFRNKRKRAATKPDFNTNVLKISNYFRQETQNKAEQQRTGQGYEPFPPKKLEMKVAWQLAQTQLF